MIKIWLKMDIYVLYQSIQPSIYIFIYYIFQSIYPYLDLNHPFLNRSAWSILLKMAPSSGTPVTKETAPTTATAHGHSHTLLSLTITATEIDRCRFI